MQNVIGVIIGLLAIALGIWFKIRGTRSSVLTVVVGLTISLILMSFTIIPTGYTGVRATFGQIDDTVLTNGFNFKIPFVQSIKQVNNKQQDVKFTGDIWGESSEKTEVYASNVLITFQVNPEKSSYILRNVSDYKNGLITQTLVNSAIKSAMVQLPDVKVTNRNEIEPMSKNTLQAALDEKYGANTITIMKITIDNMDFKEEYNKAIANKQIARQEAEKAAIENQKQIDLANTNKEKALIEAETKRIEAEADANARKISADADAYAYKVKSDAITDKLLKKWEMDARIAHGWVTIQGVNTVVSDTEQ